MAHPLLQHEPSEKPSRSADAVYRPEFEAVTGFLASAGSDNQNGLITRTLRQSGAAPSLLGNVGRVLHIELTAPPQQGAGSLGTQAHKAATTVHSGSSFRGGRPATEVRAPSLSQLYHQQSALPVLC